MTMAFELAVSALLALTALAAAAYAQWRLPFHTATAGQALFARLMLLFTGLGTGWVAVLADGAREPLEQTLAFVTGFGAVHVPAAFILWSKRLRGVSR